MINAVNDDAWELAAAKKGHAAAVEELGDRLRVVCVCGWCDAIHEGTVLTRDDESWGRWLRHTAENDRRDARLAAEETPK